jgi:hypothetical protein
MAEARVRQRGWRAVPRATAPADLATQHRVLVPEDQEFGVLGHLTPGQHHETAEQTANEQIDDRDDHSAMIPIRLPPRPDPVIEPHRVHMRVTRRAGTSAGR